MDCHLPFKRQWICAMTMGQTFWCLETRGKTCFSAGISLSKIFFESLLIDQNFTGWNTIKRSFHKKLLCTIFTFTLYIFFDNLKETTNMIKCGSDIKNRILFFRGSLVLKQHSRAGKTVNPLAIFLKHVYKCFIQTCLRAICFYTVRTTELIYTHGSKGISRLYFLFTNILFKTIIFQ